MVGLVTEEHQEYYFRNGYSTSGYYNCNYHNADTFSDGFSINSYDGIRFCTGSNARQERMRINFDGNVGMGTTTPNALLTLFGSTQLQPKITLTGQEFYTGSFTSTEGMAFLLGVNRTGNRQLWLADSANLAVNTTNTVLRLMTNAIDCVATDGLTRLPISIGATMSITAAGNVGIGITNPNCRLYTSSNLSASATVYAMRLSCGASTDGGGFGTLLGLGSEPNGWSKLLGIYHLIFIVGYISSNIVFLLCQKINIKIS
jgi:hypothetical protein